VIQQRIKATILSRIQLTPALWVPELMAEGQVLAPRSNTEFDQRLAAIKSFTDRYRALVLCEKQLKLERGYRVTGMIPTSFEQLS
jgi:hypothetical protein